MIIKKKRINKIDKYIKSFLEGKRIVCGVEINSSTIPDLQKIGFKENSIRELPKIIGKITDYNINGKILIRKDLPKKMKTREHYWSVTDWGGYEHSGVSEIEYEGYDRENIPAPNVYLEKLDINNKKYLISPVMNLSDHKLIKHVINLFLEIFSFVKISADYESLIAENNYQKVNWRILPEGENLWDQINNVISKKYKNENNKYLLIKEHFEFLDKAKPEKKIVGTGGFDDYVAFVFKNYVILESIYYGNAIYVLNDDWENVSKMSKAEIIKGNLHKARIIHTNRWKANLSNYIN